MPHRQDWQDVPSRPPTASGRKAFISRNSQPSIGIGLDQAGINGETFPTDQIRLDTASDGHLEYFAQKVVFTTTVMSVL
uniref:hypothetical protein n=1 Tax=Brytella acorum TaxID=2959299 RepID=UPI003742861A